MVARFLLIFLSGTLCQMSSGVPYHCHHYVSFEDILDSFSLRRLDLLFLSLCICVWVGGVIDFLSGLR